MARPSRIIGSRPLWRLALGILGAAALLAPPLSLAGAGRSAREHHATIEHQVTPGPSPSAHGEAELLPGGLRKIVHATVPDGPSFSIVGEHFTLDGRSRFTLQIDVEHSGAGEPMRGKRRNLLGWYFWTACRPHEYAVVYALLGAPRDAVLARTAGGLLRLAQAPMPASLHAGGVLVYAVLKTLPSELLVRARHGRTVLAESLESVGPLARETCAAEP